MIEPIPWSAAFRYTRDELYAVAGKVAIFAFFFGMGVGFLLALTVSAHAQLTSVSPDITVQAPVGGPCTAAALQAGGCTITSMSPIHSNAAPSLSLDQTMVGLTIWRTCSAATCPSGMTDTIVAPSVMGANQAMGICTKDARDIVSNPAPVLNGATSIIIGIGQCALFNSDDTGSTYLVEVSWQSNARQACPPGQHMFSAVPFKCN